MDKPLKVLGREPISYGDEMDEYGSTWSWRPKPDHIDDKPIKGNKGMYKKLDGSKYLIDALGRTIGLDKGSKYII